MTKVCTKCLVELDISNFYFRKDCGKHKKICKSCLLKQVKKYTENNKDKIKEYKSKYFQDNKEKIALKKRIYRSNNKEKFLSHNRQYEKNKLKKNINFCLKKKISHYIRKQINKNGDSCKKYLPYSIEELKNHLEKQFEPWMTWDNWGIYNVKTWNDNDCSTWTWQIDHIVPHSTFKYTSMEDEEFKKCWELENLRPLSAKQNLLDGVNKTRHRLKND